MQAIGFRSSGNDRKLANNVLFTQNVRMNCSYLERLGLMDERSVLLGVGVADS